MSTTYINGDKCNQIQLFNDTGIAEAGLITFEKKGRYYKTNLNHLYF
jgi:hypothetical protein